MQLLVSVRDPVEAALALEGGADIIDAKEPSRGALGPVPVTVLPDIEAAVPPSVPLSIALGAGPGAGLAHAVRALPTLGRTEVFLKFALTEPASPRAARLLAAAWAGTRALAGKPRLVVGFFCDHGLEEAQRWIEPAAAAGAAGLLLDTAHKQQGGLFHRSLPDAVAHVVRQAHASGLWVAVAGSLSLDTLTDAWQAGADIAAVRGAACVGGREGTVSSARVRRLAARLARLRRRQTRAEGTVSAR
jgi:uncharacterized protein (UPF0264 family)